MPLPEATIDRELLLDLTYGDAEDDCGWKVIEDTMTGTWRWGTNNHLILRRVSDNSYWEYRYQMTTGDESHNSTSDEPEQVKLTPLVAGMVTVVKYRKMVESDATA